jgi:TfoX/Sxy family transcriptional regulator of competence genes
MQVKGGIVKPDQAGEQMKRRYRSLARKLAATGIIMQGTITSRTIVRPDPQDGGRKKSYGPYYQWTYKQKGKTVTVNLTASQVKVYQKAIDNHRQLEEIIKEMRELSREICETTTQGVKKRKSRK